MQSPRGSTSVNDIEIELEETVLSLMSIRHANTEDCESALLGNKRSLPSYSISDINSSEDTTPLFQTMHEVLMVQALTLRALPAEDFTPPPEQLQHRNIVWCSGALPFVPTPRKLLLEQLEKSATPVYGYQPRVVGPCRLCTSPEVLSAAQYIIEYIPYICPPGCHEQLALFLASSDIASLPLHYSTTETSCSTKKPRIDPTAKTVASAQKMSIDPNQHIHELRSLTEVDPVRVSYRMSLRTVAVYAVPE